MTEEDAKKLWCPFARQFHQSRSMTDDVLIANRTETSAPIGTCLASACMAWRWVDQEGDYEYAITENRYSGNVVQLVPPPEPGWEDMRGHYVISVPKQFQAISSSQTAWRRKIRNSGYCGLAGEDGAP